MTKIPLANSDRRRGVLKTPDVLMRNRFIEGNPVLAEGESYTQRPALKRWLNVDQDYPVRSLFMQPGTFNDDMWAVCGPNLNRISKYGEITLVNNELFGYETGSSVSMCATGDIGTVPPFLFVADGQTLRVYIENGYATSVLDASAIANNDTVSAGGVYYKFTNGSVNAGTPAGTALNPWLVAYSGSVVQCYENLMDAINDDGTPGTTYSTALSPNLQVRAISATASGMRIRAMDYGADGNAIALTETGANMVWTTGATLAGGGSPSFTPVVVPGDYAVIDVVFIAGHVIVIPAQGQGINGRFYWIEPGYTEIDPLNFATAERSPDPIYQAIVFSDQFWLPGQSTTETWYMTGDPAAPVSRVQGVLYDRGAVPGTALQVKDSMIIADSDGGVFMIQGGAKRISTPDIEERIRKAVQQTALFI